MKVNPIRNSFTGKLNSIGKSVSNFFGSFSGGVNNEYAKFKGKVDKDTLIGAGVVALVTIFALRMIKFVKNELKNIKNNNK